MTGAKFLSRLLIVLFLVMGVAIVVVTAMMSRPPPPKEIEIAIEQLDGAQVRVAWRSVRSLEALNFEALAGAYRDRRWQIETPGFGISYDEGVARLARRDGKPFIGVAITMEADGVRLPKEYQPLAEYGEGGVLVYTGHFHPVGKDGARLDAMFNFAAAPDAKVAAFGDHAAVMKDWKSPLAHPAFIYFGPLSPVETTHVITLIDLTAPQWIIEEFDRLTPRAFDYFATVFGASPEREVKPNLFLAARPGGNEGRLSYAGDALPGQFQITLDGAAWRTQSMQGEDIFRRSTLHEAFHLWQSASASLGGEDDAAWIHEGGADAVAVDAMVALGFWDGDDLAAFAAAARRDCAAGLNEGSLSRAEERRAFTALYACGYLIAEAVARADGTTATAFWRDFMAEAKGGGGYGDGFFFDFVAARTGDEDFSRALKEFVRMPLADPAREIDRLLAAAPRASSPLAPGERR